MVDCVSIGHAGVGLNRWESSIADETHICLSVDNFYWYSQSV